MSKKRELFNDNDYSVTFFMMNERALSWKFIHSMHQITKHVNDKYGRWHHVNIYARRTGRFLIQVRYGQKMYNKYPWLLNK